MIGEARKESIRELKSLIKEKTNCENHNLNEIEFLREVLIELRKPQLENIFLSAKKENV